ncbi:hypothetical protein BJ508DRAFT_333428 [Ascobolus immersus RN42]|uniref:Uncharacterized protein n=1 Tax=Ascobolus immersus RN42 TaxID=1160509 RepID=A0A3N4HJI7_ASCIM|nr:hypothetical protein BJ508DRAFT_333428 [Ascobolus immersus RN42]
MPNDSTAEPKFNPSDGEDAYPTPASSQLTDGDNYDIESPSSLTIANQAYVECWPKRPFGTSEYQSRQGREIGKRRGSFNSMKDFLLSKDANGYFYPAKGGAKEERFYEVDTNTFMNHSYRIQVKDKKRRPVLLFRLEDLDDEGRCTFGPGIITIDPDNKMGLVFEPWDDYKDVLGHSAFDFTPPNLLRVNINRAIQEIYESVSPWLSDEELQFGASLRKSMQEVLWKYFEEVWRKMGASH